MEVHEVFNELSTEIYYGLNFRVAMLQADDETILKVRTLINIAKAGRGQKHKFSPEMDGEVFALSNEGYVLCKYCPQDFPSAIHSNSKE
jgi:hypothetical protein